MKTMTPARSRRLHDSLYQRLLQELKWFYDEHGGSLDAYVARYGSVNEFHHFGAGGEAIYAADHAAVEKLIAQALKGYK